MKIYEYFDNNHIPCFPINLKITIDENGGKKKTIEKYEEEGVRPDYTKDFDNQYLYNKRRSYQHYEYWVVDTRLYPHIDVDFEKNKNYVNDTIQYVEDLKINTPYFLSVGKGNPHFIYEDKSLNSKVRHQTKHDDIEVLSGQWSYFKKNDVMFNHDKPLKTLQKDILKENTKASKSTKGNIANIAKQHQHQPQHQMKRKYKKISEEQKEILDNITINYLDNYGDWLKIIWSLNNEFGDLELINNICSKSKKYKGIEDVKKYLYDDKKRLLTFGTINYYSKLSNSTKYFDIKSRHTPIFFSNTDYELAEFYLNCSGDNVIKQDDELYFYNNNFWVKDTKFNLIKKHMRDILFTVFKTKREYLNKLPYSEDNEKKIKNISSSIKFINTSSKQKSIIEQLSVILQNQDYNFDCNRRELFCFTNTAYNLDTKEFENLNKYDYITKNCGYEWREPTTDEINKINKFFVDIQPSDESRESVKSILRRGMYGQQDEYFILFNGRGGNGKGVLMELFKASLNDYFYEGSNGVLTEKVKKSGANQEVANCDMKRTILYSEPDEGIKLNGSTIKYMTGNPVVNARGLYSQNTKINIHAVQIMECNQRPAIHGRLDASFFRRLIDILFPTQFVNSKSEILNNNYKLKDDSFKKDDFKESHKFALIKILMDSKDKIYIPNCVKKRSEQYLLSNDDIYNFIKLKYKVTTNEKDYVSTRKIYEWYKIDGSYNLLSKEDKKDMTKKKFTELVCSNPKFTYCDRKKINNKTCRSIVLYMKEKDENEETDSENEDEEIEFEKDEEE